MRSLMLLFASLSLLAAPFTQHPEDYLDGRGETADRGQLLNLGSTSAYSTQDRLTGFVVRGRFEEVAERGLVAGTVPTFVETVYDKDPGKKHVGIVSVMERKLGHHSVFVTF
jgi:hypothetical protein